MAGYITKMKVASIWAVDQLADERETQDEIMDRRFKSRISGAALALSLIGMCGTGTTLLALARDIILCPQRVFLVLEILRKHEIKYFY